MHQVSLFNRTIVEENNYATEVHALSNQHKRVWDIDNSIKWVLSRKPDAGDFLQTGSAFRVYSTFSIGATPGFSVLYLFDEENDPNCVYLYSIWVTEEE